MYMHSVRPKHKDELNAFLRGWLIVLFVDNMYITILYYTIHIYHSKIIVVGIRAAILSAARVTTHSAPHTHTLEQCAVRNFVVAAHCFLMVRDLL